jgi:hypothetical protein
MDEIPFFRMETELPITGVPETGYAPFFFGADGSTLPFRFTDASFTRILSALCNGAYLTYGDEGRQVVWDFLVNVEFPMPLCADIIACIEGDDDVREAIIDLVSEDISDPDGTLYDDITNRLIQDEAYLASLADVLTPYLDTGGEIGSSEWTDAEFWAACVGVARYTNTSFTDFLEIVETATNATELIAKYMNDVPFFSELFKAVGLTGWLDTFDYFQGTFAELYASGWTETEGGTMYKFACALYCKCHPDKVINVDRIFEVTIDLISEFTAVTYDNMANIIATMLGVTDDPEGVVWAAFFVSWGFARLSTVFGLQRISNKVLRVVLADGSQQSEGTFEEHCDDCPVPVEACVNFLLGGGTWRPAGDDAGNAQFTENGIGQENNTYLTIISEGYTDVNSVTLTFDSGFPFGGDDYHKYFVQVANIDISNAQTFGLTGGLLIDNPVTFTTSGANWTSLRIQIIFGGFTYPPNAHATDPVYIIEICVSEGTP